MALRSQVSMQGMCVVVKCVGIFNDDAEIDRLLELHKMVGRQHRRVVVDLFDLEVLDPSHLVKLWLRYTKARADGWRIAFAGPTVALVSLLELHRLDEAFEIYPTLPEAIRALHSVEWPSSHGHNLLRAS